MAKKANDQKQLSKAKIKPSIFIWYIHPQKCKRELLALEGFNFPLPCNVFSVSF